MLHLLSDIISPAEKALFNPLVLALILGIVSLVVAGTVVLIVLLVKKKKRGKQS